MVDSPCSTYSLTSDQPETHTDEALKKLFHHGQRVRFIYWRQMSGAKPTVFLVGFIAVLAFVTGMSNLSQATVPLDGPLTTVVPVPESLARFWAVTLAFILVGLTFGLRRRKRLIWYLSMIALPALALLPFVTMQVHDIVVLLLVLLALPLLVINREQFDQPFDLSPLQVASLSSIVGVLAYATVGSYVMRDRYVGIETWTDAIYYVIVTIATVGYGDATPTTQETKLFTLSFILIGTGAFTVAIGSLLIPAIEKRMAAAVGNMKPSELKLLDDHVLVLGYGELTVPIVDELVDEVDLVVVTEDTERATELRDRNINVLTADPTQTESLRDANIENARAVVVATEEDARDIMAILAVKQTNPEVYVVSAASDRHNIDKIEDVGADDVISPIVLGGRLIGQSVVEETRPDLDFGEDEDEDTTNEA